MAPYAEVFRFFIFNLAASKLGLSGPRVDDSGVLVSSVPRYRVIIWLLLIIISTFPVLKGPFLTKYSFINPIITSLIIIDFYY